MATEISSEENMVDSAIGPVAVVSYIVEGYDIDDHVTSTVNSQATRLRILNLLDKVDPKKADERPIVNMGGKSAGGY